MARKVNDFSVSDVAMAARMRRTAVRASYFPGGDRQDPLTGQRVRLLPLDYAWLVCADCRAGGYPCECGTAGGGC